MFCRFFAQNSVGYDRTLPRLIPLGSRLTGDWSCLRYLYFIMVILYQHISTPKLLWSSHRASPHRIAQVWSIIGAKYLVFGSCPEFPAQALVMKCYELPWHRPLGHRQIQITVIPWRFEHRISGDTQLQPDSCWGSQSIISPGCSGCNLNFSFQLQHLPWMPHDTLGLKIEVSEGDLRIEPGMGIPIPIWIHHQKWRTRGIGHGSYQFKGFCMILPKVFPPVSNMVSIGL